MLTGDGGLIGVWALDIADGEIQGIRSVVNPEKLGPRRPGRRRVGGAPGAGALVQLQFAQRGPARVGLALVLVVR